MKKIILSGTLMVLLIVIMIIIYKLSDMNTQVSNGRSIDLIALFIEDTLEVTNDYGITNSRPNEVKLAKASKLINAPLRKVMHASVYCMLAFIIILFANIVLNNKHYWIALIITMLVCISFAILDEYHQTFVSGRTGQILDVCIDSGGIAMGSLLYTSYYLIYRSGYKKAKKDFDIKYK